MNLKNIIRYAGVLLIGALGNGLWELMKPILSSIVNVILTVATLGIDSLRDGMYAAASHSIIGTIQLQATLQVLAGLICAVGVLLMGHISDLSGQRIYQMSRISKLMMMTCAIILLIGSFRTNYIGGLVSYQNGLMVRLAPYITDVELKKIDAESLEIVNRSQYIEHIQSLQGRIKANGGKYPERNFF